MIDRVGTQISNGIFSELVTNLSKLRLPFLPKGKESDLHALCDALIEERSEAGILHLADVILMTYDALDDDGRLAFFTHLNSQLDIDADHAATLATKYAADPTPAHYSALSTSIVSKRFRLFPA